MDDREFPTYDDLFNGVMNDGSAPPLHSGKLYDPWEKPLPTDRVDRSEAEMTAEELHYKIDMAQLEDYDLIGRLARGMVNAGIEVIEGTRENDAPDVDAPTSSEEDSKPVTVADTTTQDSDGAVGIDASTNAENNEERAPKPRGIPDIPEPPEPAEPRQPRGRYGPRVLKETNTVWPDAPTEGVRDEVSKERRDADKLIGDIDATSCNHDGGPAHVNAKPRPNQLCTGMSKGQILTMAERGAKLLAVVTEKRAKLAHTLVERAMAVDVKKDFVWDRAHAVIAVTLLHLDETFRDIGFGSWMPFRYPDQWLMFCGVLNRVLAANGLIHSENADVYRRLLEETPTVEFPEGMLSIDDRIEKLKTPENWARCWINRGAKNMAELKDRLEKEVWNKPP